MKKNEHAAALGRMTSNRKKQTSAENGRKGGRPIATGIQTVKSRHIAEEWDEGEDGYWIRLKSGWKWAGDLVEAVHCIHESTKTKARSESVAPCTCRDCALLSQ